MTEPRTNPGEGGNAAYAQPPIASAPVVPAVPPASAAYAGGFFVLNLVVKLLCINLNMAEYTDGLIQLMVFEKDFGLYPPLYGALAWALTPLGFDLEFAAKLVSVIASAAAVIPVYLMARWLFDESAGRFAALFYTVSPLVLRWSIRVMADSLFLSLSAFAIMFMIRSWILTSNASERRLADRSLAWATLLAAAAAMTRYQGAFLAIPLLMPAIAFLRSYRAVPLRALVACVAWLALPVWVFTHEFVHSDQFTDRTTGQWITTLLGYLNLFESFLLITPWFYGLPFFVFALAGIFRAAPGPGIARAFYSIWGVWALLILVLQSLFGSFQHRYMLPLFPGLLALSGAGCAWLEAAFARHRRARLFSVILIASLLYVSFLACAVLILQRQAFADQKQAAMFIRNNVPPEAPVFANESYGGFTEVGCLKLSFWSGRDVKPLFPYMPRRPGSRPPKFFPDGSHVILGSVYSSDETLDYISSNLTFFYHFRLVAAFDSSIYPITDDLMAGVGNQNPIGWVLRYTLQPFTTHVYVIDSRRTQAEIEDILNRQIAPPGTRPIRGPDGRLTVSREPLTTAPLQRPRR